MSRLPKSESDLLYPRLELKPGSESWAIIEKLMIAAPTMLLDKTIVGDLESMLEYGNVGGQASHSDCDKLSEGLISIAKQHGFPRKPDANQKRASDAEMATYLHLNMRISRNEAAHEGVWNALSCYFCPAVVAWRWSGGEEEEYLTATEEGKTSEPVPVSERWFTQSKSERHAIGRLWWRAELLRDENAAKPYWILSGLIEDELVQCTERGLFVTHRDAVLSLAKKHLKDYKGKTSRMLVFRSAIKSLRRMASLVDLDAAARNGTLEKMVSTCYKEALTRK